jgi:hypothetical protein
MFFDYAEEMHPEEKETVTCLLCVSNDGASDLTVGKLYQPIPDTTVRKDEELVRVTDDTGEDYLFHTMFFKSVEIPLETTAYLGFKVKR